MKLNDSIQSLTELSDQTIKAVMTKAGAADGALKTKTKIYAKDRVRASINSHLSPRAKNSGSQTNPRGSRRGSNVSSRRGSNSDIENIFSPGK